MGMRAVLLDVERKDGSRRSALAIELRDDHSKDRQRVIGMNGGAIMLTFIDTDETRLYPWKWVTPWQRQAHQVIIDTWEVLDDGQTIRVEL